MKKLFGKRFYRIPVALVSVLLALVLFAGGVFAINGYPFFTSTLQVQVEEVIVLGMFDTWDNLHPYESDVNVVWEDSGAHDDGTGTLGDVTITLEGTLELPVISITTAAETPYVGEGFTPGESIIIPVNFRNGSSPPFTLGAIVTGDGGLDLDYCWLVNNGEPTGEESGQAMARNFKDNGDWAPLESWSEVIAGNGGKSGSAVIGAEVLFVRIKAPGNMAPGVCQFTVAFTRDEVLASE